MDALSRRAFLQRASVVTLALGALPRAAYAAKPENVAMRLGWLANAQYAGDFVALDKGYFKERGIELKIEPGGPSIDPVSLTAGGSSTIGNVASIAAMFLARSNGLPVKAFAAALQRHPFAFITLDKSISSPKDFVGKKIGIQATARPLINAVIAKYQLPRDQVQVQVIGSDTTPLKTGQVDVITGWVIDAPQMAAVGPEARTLLLWDLGIRLYAYTYFTTDEVLRTRGDMLADFLGASARGWAWAADHPEESVDIVLKYARDLKRDLEIATWKRETPFLWSDKTKENGWGWMEAQVWDDAIKVYADLGLLKTPVTSKDAMTQDVLKRVDGRPKR
ncbi:MAG TPA: ABC transporter substrate-binding protein [Methylomirabilota bacterium]|jgi:NitT/TauT family transport system substrate-binding protein|nr:ABC transporter substrate-binding protein [Methylomirabilota bacterium]